MLEMVKEKYLNILIGEGRNNFIVEYNENREEEAPYVPIFNEDPSRLN